MTCLRLPAHARRDGVFVRLSTGALPLVGRRTGARRAHPTRRCGGEGRRPASLLSCADRARHTSMRCRIVPTGVAGGAGAVSFRTVSRRLPCMSPSTPFPCVSTVLTFSRTYPAVSPLPDQAEGRRAGGRRREEGRGRGGEIPVRSAEIPVRRREERVGRGPGGGGRGQEAGRREPEAAEAGEGGAGAGEEGQEDCR